MGKGPENRVERIVSELLRGKRLRLRGGDADEKEAITAAARLVAAGQGVQRMHPAFRKRMAQALDAAPSGAWLTRRAALVAGLGVVTGVAAGALMGRAMELYPSAYVRNARLVAPSYGRGGWSVSLPAGRHHQRRVLGLLRPSVRAAVER